MIQEFGNLKDYEEMELSLSLEDMTRIHQQMMEEIGEDL